MKKLFFFLLFLVELIPCYAQLYSVTGKINSAADLKGLSFANLRVLNTGIGTASNLDGVYELKLKAEKYKLVASYIGYESDTLQVELSQNIQLNFNLEPIALKIDEITVVPGTNPALAIIQQAIRAKQERNSRLNDYEFTAFTKGIIKTVDDISTNDNSVGIDIGGADTAKLKITGLFENESKGYFKKPDSYKEEIIARKQSANFPSSVNTLTGGRLIQDFYSDDIRFFDRDLLSPVADNAPDYYFFLLQDSLAYGDGKVYKIYFEPDDRSDPGFYGTIFITGDSYNLVKLDININDAANPGGVFTKVNVFQQFVPFHDGIYMPIDYRLFVEGNPLGLFKFGFEFNSILYNYSINSKISEDFFDMSVLTVMPDADKKDTTYWSSIQSIPNTMEETDAYYRIDSLESLPVTFWDRFSFLSERIPVTDNFSITGTMGLYHFNRIEGNGLDFGFYFRRLLDRRLRASLELSNGFADKRFKWDFETRYHLGTYRTHSVSVNAYRRLDVLFNESDEYNTLLPTLTSLFGKYDFKDYYYTDGFDIDLDSEVLPILRLNAGYAYRNYESAVTNSDFSFFNRKKEYDINPAVFETSVNALKAGFLIDFRKYIEDGYYRRRTSLGNSYILFSGDVFMSRKGLFGGQDGIDFDIYRLDVWSKINSVWSTDINVSLKSIWSNDALPYQLMYALPGNIQSLGQDFTFRTVDFADVYGDRVVTLGVKYNFKDALLDKLNVPVLEDLQLLLSVHLNAAWTSVSDKTVQLNSGIIPDDFTEYKRPMVELGFSLGQMLMPIQLEFTWRLNYREENTFVFGINSGVF